MKSKSRSRVVVKSNFLGTLWTLEFIFVALLFGVLIILSSVSSESHVSFSPANLKALYTLDNLGGNNLVSDVAGLSNGTASSVSIVPGIIGNAFQFDGSTSKVTIPGQGLNFPGAFTVSFWFRGSKNSAGQFFAGKSGVDGSNIAWQASLATGGLCNGINFYVSEDGSAGNDQHRAYRRECDKLYQDGNWHLFTGVFVPKQRLEMYLDGVSVGQTIGNVSALDQIYSSNQNMTVGFGFANSSSQIFYQGSIDNLRLYDRALSSDEISSFFRITNSDKQLAYNFETLSSGQTPDSSSNNYAGTIVGNPSLIKGMEGSGAASFNGAGDSIQGPTNLNLPETFSVQFWFRGSKNSVNQVLAGKWDGSTGIAWQVSLATQGVCDGLTFYISEDGSSSDRAYVRDCGNLYQDGEWHLFTGIFEPGMQMKMFVDKNERGQLVGDISRVNGIHSNNHPIRIGTGVSGPYKGAIDAFKVYSRVLKQDEIAKEYDLQTFRLKYTFDDMTSTQVKDSSLNGNLGIINQAKQKTGLEGQGLSFDGDKDYVDVTDSDALDLSSGAFTISLWTKTSSSSEQTILEKMSSNRSRGYSLGIKDGYARFSAYCNNTNSEDLVSDRGVSNDKWHNIVVVRDNSDSRTYLYVDGEAVASRPDIDCSDYSTSSILRLGGRLYPTSGKYYTGMMDEISIYGTAFSDSQVEDLYQSFEDNAQSSNRTTSSSGSQNSTSCQPSWSCAWGACIEGVKTYVCTDTKSCGNLNGRPTSNGNTEECNVEDTIDEEGEIIETGTETSTSSSNNSTIIILSIAAGLLFILVVVFGIILYLRSRHPKTTAPPQMRPQMPPYRPPSMPPYGPPR